MSHTIHDDPRPSVLISGGSIAGPAVAWWLSRKYGFRTTIIERAPELRTGGQNIDVRGAGREVLRRMNLEEKVLEANTTEIGLAFVNSKGDYKAVFPASANGPTAEIEILHGDLAEIFYEATKDSSTWIFGDQITSIKDEQPDGLGPLVSFASGREERYDFVILADGVGSRTRKLVFGDEVVQKPIGMFVAFLTIPRMSSDLKYGEWYIAPGRKSITTRPDNHGNTRAILAYMADGQDKTNDNDPRNQIETLKRKFKNSGGCSDRIVDNLDNASDLYYERLRQIKAPHYSRGKVVLLGDAGYCASPISGMGTSLALVGSYILAGDLAREYSNSHSNSNNKKNQSTSTSTLNGDGHTPKPERAFEEYQKKMEPYVKKAQKLPLGAPGIIHPESRWGVAVVNFVFGLFAKIARIGAALGISLDNVTPSGAIDLPDYSQYIVQD